MENHIDHCVAEALDNLESLLSTHRPDAALRLRKTVIMILLRNGLIEASRMRLEDETRVFVAASRVIENNGATH